MVLRLITLNVITSLTTFFHPHYFSRGEHEPILKRELAAGERRIERSHREHYRGYSGEDHAKDLRPGPSELSHQGHSKAGRVLQSVKEYLTIDL